MMEIFKQDGLTIWHYEFKYTTKYLQNLGYKEVQGAFTGTYKAFGCMNGKPINHNMWDIKKRHATKEEYECLKSFWKYERSLKKEG